jgi:cellulose synthase/poly-beta-1,6-N-acetylglucosamine synthase-like glycosyltransferase
LAQRIVVLVPAHDEERSLGATLRAVMAQQRPADRVVVVADNCTDATAEVARSVPGVTVLETRGNRRRKAGALNQAWRSHAADADLVVCVDADTLLPPDALARWEREFAAAPRLGGCAAKFTMLPAPGASRYARTLVRLQRAEYARWTDVALRRGRRTSVLAGAASCLRNDALRAVAAWRAAHEPDGDGPWTYRSQVEDFELTFRLRQQGFTASISAGVRAYTDSMRDLRSLWAQRMKWQTGTARDLLRFGLNRLTLADWGQQALAMLAALLRLALVAVMALALASHRLAFYPLWLLLPLLFSANEARQAFRIPHRQRSDVVLAATLLPHESYSWLRAGWFAASWFEVLAGALTGRRKDRWTIQRRMERKGE